MFINVRNDRIYGSYWVISIIGFYLSIWCVFNLLSGSYATINIMLLLHLSFVSSQIWQMMKTDLASKSRISKCRCFVRIRTLLSDRRLHNQDITKSSLIWQLLLHSAIIWNNENKYKQRSMCHPSLSTTCPINML